MHASWVEKNNQVTQSLRKETPHSCGTKINQYIFISDFNWKFGQLTS